jgi:hypothetical protein
MLKMLVIDSGEGGNRFGDAALDRTLSYNRVRTVREES